MEIIIPLHLILMREYQRPDMAERGRCSLALPRSKMVSLYVVMAFDA